MRDLTKQWNGWGRTFFLMLWEYIFEIIRNTWLKACLQRIYLTQNFSDLITSIRKSSADFGEGVVQDVVRLNENCSNSSAYADWKTLEDYWD